MYNTATKQAREKDLIAPEDFKWLTTEASRTEIIRELVMLAEETVEDAEGFLQITNHYYGLTDRELTAEIHNHFSPLEN